MRPRHARAPTPHRERVLARKLVTGVDDVNDGLEVDIAYVLAGERARLLSDPAVVLEAAERLLREAAPEHNGYFSVRLWYDDTVSIEAGVSDGSCQHHALWSTLVQAHAALVQSRSAGDGSSGGG
jgi:hypothetical protein